MLCAIPWDALDAHSSQHTWSEMDTCFRKIHAHRTDDYVWDRGSVFCTCLAAAHRSMSLYSRGNRAVDLGARLRSDFFMHHSVRSLR